MGSPPVIPNGKGAMLLWTQRGQAGSLSCLWCASLVWRAVAVRHAASISAASTQRCAHAQRRCLPREASHAIGEQHEPKTVEAGSPKGDYSKKLQIWYKEKKLDRRKPAKQSSAPCCKVGCTFDSETSRVFMTENSYEYDDWACAAFSRGDYLLVRARASNLF